MKIKEQKLVESPALEDLSTVKKLLQHRQIMLMGRLASGRGNKLLNTYRLEETQTGLELVEQDIAKLQHPTSPD